MCSVCLREASDRNRMAGVFRCGNNPEYDEFMRRFVAYVIRRKGSRLWPEGQAEELRGGTEICEAG